MKTDDQSFATYQDRYDAAYRKVDEARKALHEAVGDLYHAARELDRSGEMRVDFYMLRQIVETY